MTASRVTTSGVGASRVAASGITAITTRTTATSRVAAVVVTIVASVASTPAPARAIAFITETPVARAA